MLVILALYSSNPTAAPPKETTPQAMRCLTTAVTDMACIPAGYFTRGTSTEHTCEQGENRRHKTTFGPPTQVWLQTYYMDKTEVTYEAYQSCVKKGLCQRARPFYNDFNRPRQPMMGANWYQAKQFCEANGKHLPTEAQWEKAARGPEGQSTPFGNDTVTCQSAVIKDKTGRSCGVRKKGKQGSKGRVWIVGKKPPGAYGLFDMVGNAEEWVSDWWSVSMKSCGVSCTGIDPQGPCNGDKKCPGYKLKMVKGGSWYWPASHATGWHRRPHYPNNKPYHHFGFRCAASVEEARKLSPK